MFNLLTKIIFSIKRPKIIIVAGDGKEAAIEAIYNVLARHFRVKKLWKISPRNILGAEILILPWKNEFRKIFSFFAKKSRLATLVITAVGEIPPDKIFFGGDRKKVKEITEFAKILPSPVHLILNFDDETTREIDDITNLRTVTFGFQKRADFQASDTRLNGGTNFKINYKGNIVPCWLEKLFGKEQIYAASVAFAVGNVFGLNLVQISQSLKDYQGKPGKKK